MCCFGYRKNPLDDRLGTYSFKPNVTPAIAKLISNFIVAFTQEIYKAAKPMCRNLPEFKKFAKAIQQYNLSTLGGTVFTQFGVGFEYWSHVHTDADFSTQTQHQIV